MLKNKNDALVALKNYKAMREKQSDCEVKVLPTNRGREYMWRCDNYFKGNAMTQNVTAFDLLK